jgi:hypothetical protein
MSLAAISSIPVVGWILAPIFSACLAIPFFVLWNWFEIRKFFYFLPDVYLNIGFLQCVGLFIIISILKVILLPSFNIKNKVKDTKKT